jgi:hypothetical protein
LRPTLTSTMLHWLMLYGDDRKFIGGVCSMPPVDVFLPIHLLFSLLSFRDLDYHCLKCIHISLHYYFQLTPLSLSLSAVVSDRSRSTCWLHFCCVCWHFLVQFWVT